MYITERSYKKESSLFFYLKGLKQLPRPNKNSAFTIIELLIVIVIIGILSTVGIVSFANIQSSTRDTQRSSKITIIAEALEKYYSQHGEYPSCDAITKQSISTVVSTTLVGVDPSNLTTPSSTGGTNSFAALATCDPTAINNLSSDVFAYVGNNSTPCLTTSGQTAACLQYTLKYREESTGNTISLVSRHTIPTLASPAAPTTTLTLNGSNVLATITPVSCPVGSITQYGIRNRTNTGSWSSYTAWDTITTATQAANQGVKYEYQSEARCYPDGTATSASNPAVGAVSNVYINPITTVPTVPVVAANTVGATTTWSWPASTGCAAGTVVNYRYDYTISSGYDSGWVTPGNPTALSISFTTSTQALAYTVSVQAKCTNANTSSGWSGSGSASYYRPSYGNAVASDLLSGKTATVLAGSITGTMPNKASYNSSVSNAVASGTLYTRISPGAYLTATGSGYPEITSSVPDLVPGNIKSGKTILGVAGSMNTPAYSKVIMSVTNPYFNPTDYWMVGYHTSSTSNVTISSTQLSVTFRGHIYDETAVTKDMYNISGMNKLIIYSDGWNIPDTFVALSTSQGTRIDQDVIRSWAINTSETNSFWSLDISGMTGSYYIKFGYVQQGSSSDAGHSCTIMEMLLTN